MKHLKKIFFVFFLFLSLPLSFAEDNTDTEGTVTLPNSQKMPEFTAAVAAESVSKILEKNRVTLEKYGISFNEKGWDFSRIQITPAELKKNPREFAQVKTALGLVLGSEKAAAAVLDSKRTRAVQIGAKDHPGSAVLLPPDAVAGRIRNLDRATYDNKINEAAEKIKKEMNHYLDKVEQANAFFTLQSRAELYAEADTSLRVANDLLKQRLLRDLGVPQENLESLLKVIQDGLKTEKEKIADYAASLRNAIVVAAVAPIVPLALPLLPGAGAAALKATGSALAAATVKTAAVSGLIGLGLGYSKIAGHALLDSSKAGSADFTTHLTDSMAKEGSEAVIWGVVGTVIPAGLHGISIGYHAIRAGKISLEAAQLMVNLGAAIGFGLVALDGGVQGGKACYASLTKARESVKRAAEGEGSAVAAQAEFAYAGKICLDIGIDLAFFLVQTGMAGKKAYDSYQAKRARQENIEARQERPAALPAAAHAKPSAEAVIQRAHDLIQKAAKSTRTDIPPGKFMQLLQLVDDCEKKPPNEAALGKIQKLSDDISAILAKIPDSTGPGGRKYPPPSGMDTLAGTGYKNDVKIPFIQDTEILSKHPSSRTETLLYPSRPRPVEVGYSEHGVPIIQQQALRGCTAAASAMLIKGRGGKVNVPELFDTNLGNAHSMELSIQRAAFAPKTTTYQGPGAPVVQLIQLIKENGPAIVGVGGEIGGHVIVVDNVNLVQKTARIRDPYHGWEITITVDALSKRIGGRLEATQIVSE